MRHGLRADDVDHIRRHPPPVVDRLLPLLRIRLRAAAAEDIPHHLLIEFSPVPDRRCQILQRPVIPFQINTVFSGCIAGRDHIIVRYENDPLLIQLLPRIRSFDLRPHQMDLHIGIDHLGAQRERVDIGHGSIDGVVRHITQPVGPGQRCGDGPQQELGLIHPRVIGADGGIGHHNRTVVYLHLRMLDRGAHTLVYHLRCRGKDQLAACRHRQLDRRFHLCLRVRLVEGHRLDPATERLLQIMPAQLVGIGPAGSLYRLRVNKRYFQGIRHARRYQLIQKRGLDLFRILYKLNLAALVGQRDLRPHLLQRL